MKRKSMGGILLVAMLLSLTACETGNNGIESEVSVTDAIQEVEEIGAETEEVATEEVASEEWRQQLQDILDGYTEDDFKNVFDKRTDEYVYITGEEDAELILLEQFDEITLYLSESTGCLILTEGTEKEIFDIPCISSHGILPDYLYQDLDQDGEKEIAVSCHVGQGTNVCVDFFYVLDRNAVGIFESKQFTEEDYISQMEEHFSYTYDEEKEEVQYYVDGETVGEPFSIYGEYPKEEFGECTFAGIQMLNFVEFLFEEDEIRLIIQLEGRSEEWQGASIFQTDCMVANVEYDSDGTFYLSDVELKSIAG